MTTSEILASVRAAGIQLRADGERRLIASPRNRLTDDLRELIRTHRAELLEALGPTPDPAYAGEPEPEDLPRSAPEHGAECMRCANLRMTVEVHEGTRRVFWWRCKKGHALLEGRNFGERVLLAPPDCHDFEQWQAGQR